LSAETKVEDIMNRTKPVIIKEDKTIDSVWKEIDTSGQNEFVVVDTKNNPRKIVSVIDIAGEEKTKTIANISNKLDDVYIVSPSTRIESIRNDLTKHSLTLVSDGDQVVGVVRPIDIVNFWKKKA
jgi:CBS domain containing-hemolysin-like protein